MEKSPLTPEQKARRQIAQSPDGVTISAGLGVAILEFRLQTGFSDYLLYADGKTICVIEAKTEGHTVTGATQPLKCTAGLPDGVSHHRLPLPFAYETNGTVTQLTDCRQPEGLLLSPAGGTGPPSHAREPAAGQPAPPAPAGRRPALGCPSRRHPQFQTLAGPGPSAQAIPGFVVIRSQPMGLMRSSTHPLLGSSFPVVALPARQRRESAQVAGVLAYMPKDSRAVDLAMGDGTRCRRKT